MFKHMQSNVKLVLANHEMLHSTRITGTVDLQSQRRDRDLVVQRKRDPHAHLIPVKELERGFDGNVQPRRNVTDKGNLLSGSKRCADPCVRTDERRVKRSFVF